MDEIELKVLAEQWQAIVNREERNRFYDETVFPAICQVVVAREQSKFPEPYAHLILPVGLSPEPLILSILILRPEKVYLLYTRESEKYLDRIVRAAGLRLSQVDKDEVDDTNVPDIYQKVKAIYERWDRPERVAVDISGGKKSMVGGCALAGSLIRARLFYIDSDFIQELRKPRPGSEHLAVLDNPYDVFGDLEFERAQALFAKLDFVSAAALLGDLQGKTSAPEVYEARARLCQAYAAWDDWRIKEATEFLAQAIETIDRYRRAKPDTPLSGQLPRLRSQLDVLARIEMALALNVDDAGQEQQLLTQSDLYQPIIGTLREGALRQEKRGKFDVAALLWYRLIELMSQRRLSGHGLLTVQPDYALSGKSTSDLLALYQSALEAGQTKKKSNGLPLRTELPESIALMDGYVLLKALNDPFVDTVHLGKIRSSINARNKGIFAHGFKPLDQKDYEEFKGLALKLMDAFAKAEIANYSDWETCIFVERL